LRRHDADAIRALGAAVRAQRAKVLAVPAGLDRPDEIAPPIQADLASG
jgi:hypothetical protein